MAQAGALEEGLEARLSVRCGTAERELGLGSGEPVGGPAARPRLPKGSAGFPGSCFWSLGHGLWTRCPRTVDTRAALCGLPEEWHSADS